MSYKDNNKYKAFAKKQVQDHAKIVKITIIKSKKKEKKL